MGESADSAESQPQDTMHGRAPGSGLKMRVLLELDRRLLTALLLGAVFVALVLLGAVAPVSLRAAVQASDPVETLFQALTTAIITGVTLVVTINQLVLSQELGAVGDQRERMSGSMQFRTDVEDVIDASVSPAEPSSFLQALVDASGQRATALADAVEESRDEQFRERVDDYVESLVTNATAVSDRLEDAQFGTFDLLLAALDYNYSWKIYEARRLRTEHDGALTEESAAALDAIVEVLEFFGSAREHFKTLYFEWELINLSRALLYSSVPALVVSIGCILFLDPAVVTGTTLGVDTLVVVVAAATTVALVPFLLFLSYVLRIATVAKRTLAVGSFVLRETGRSDDVDRD